MLWLSASAALASFPAHDAPFKAGNIAAEDAAVVIGVEDYFALPDVPHAQRDAQAVEDLMIYTVGVPLDHVLTVSAPASRERIEKAIDQAAGLVGDQGTLWVYFAGHGAASPSTGDRLLLGADTLAEADSFEARSVSIPWVQEHTSGKGARTVLMVDACYAGTSRAGAELLPGKRFAVPSYATPKEAGWIEWHAAEPNQLSGPLDVARHGAFTWAMVGALRGWADGQLDDQPDGTITATEAQLYVAQVLRTVGVHDQKPVLKAADEGTTLLRAATLEPRPADAALRDHAQAPAPAPAPAPQARPVATAPGPDTPPPMPQYAPCEPAEASKHWGPMVFPGTAPHHAWMCRTRPSEGSWALVQIPPVEGQSAMELLTRQVAPYEHWANKDSAEGVPMPMRSQRPNWDERPMRLAVGDFFGGKCKMPDATHGWVTKGPCDAVSEHDASTWPTSTLSAPSGAVDARWIPLAYQSGRDWSAMTWMAVEDPREAGSLLLCGVRTARDYDTFVQRCVGALESMLAEDRW